MSRRRKGEAVTEVVMPRHKTKPTAPPSIPCGLGERREFAHLHPRIRMGRMSFEVFSKANLAAIPSDGYFHDAPEPDAKPDKPSRRSNPKASAPSDKIESTRKRKKKGA